MKYGIRYYKGCPLLETADDIIIKYNHKDPELLNFVQKWKPEQRIVIDITNIEDTIEENLTLFRACSQVHNIAILCSKYQDYVELAEVCLKFFFIEGASTLDELQNQIRLGVSDIYIINELGFCVKQIKEAYKDEFNIRVFPNIAQSIATIDNNITKFFIRPEDIDLYGKYVDYFEFKGPLDKQKVLYDIYEEGRWLGNLNILILDLHQDISSMGILPETFGEMRVDCRKKCVLKQCNICDRVLSIAQLLQEKNIGIKKEKRIYESEEENNTTDMSDESGRIIEET